MLSRVANTLYWMTRYVERADNLARLIEVIRQLLLDHERLDTDRLRAFWQPIILSTGDEEYFRSHYPDFGGTEVIRFLTDDPNNPNSITSCIAQARENARSIRDQIADEIWEELNALFLFTRSSSSSRLVTDDPALYYGNIRRAAFTFHGTAAATTPRDEHWDFMELGRHLERADKTTRFLDVASYLPTEDDSSRPQTLHWSAILRACGALSAYRAAERIVTARNVVKLLVFSSHMPRSVRFCIDSVDQCLHRISGSARSTFTNDAEKESGRLLADLSYGEPDDAFAAGLHAFLDDLQTRFNEVGDAIFRSYVLMPEVIELSPPADPRSISAAAAWQLQIQQQQ